MNPIPLPQDLRDEAKNGEQPEPAYDLVVPGHVMKIPNKNLNMNAKHCYGVIRSLTRKRGYCWGSNPYLASLMGCTTRAIQKWLAQMVACQIIVIEHFMDGDQYLRRIWLSEEFKNNFRYEQEFVGGTNNCSPYIEKRDIREKPLSKDRGKKTAAPPASDKSSALCEKMLESIRKVDENFQPEAYSKWPEEMERLMKKRPVEEIEFVLDRFPMLTNAWLLNQCKRPAKLMKAFSDLLVTLKKDRGVAPPQNAKSENDPKPEENEWTLTSWWREWMEDIESGLMSEEKAEEIFKMSGNSDEYEAWMQWRQEIIEKRRARAAPHDSSSAM